MDRVAPVGGKGERSPWRQWGGVEHREPGAASPGPGFGWRHRSPLSPKPTGQDSETQGPAPTTTSSRRQGQISTGFNCWRAPSAQPGLARLGCAGRPVAIIIARDQSAEAGINSTLPDGQGQRGEKKGQPAAFIKHCPACTAAGRGTRACAGTNIVAFSPGPHLGSVAVRWTCMVGGRLAGRWVAACGLWWCGVVSGHCCTTKPFAFFSFPSPTTSWTLSSAKTDTERSAKLDAGIGRDASSRHHPPPAVHAHCLVAGLGRRSPGCSERLSSSGCCKASGTPVTECLAPEQAPAAPALTGAHEKKGNLPCRLSLPRVCRSRSHGPAVPHSSTVPKQLAHLPRLGGIPAIVSAFASCRGRRVCLASTRSSTADRKTMARPPPSCLHSITRFLLLKDLGGPWQKGPA